MSKLTASIIAGLLALAVAITALICLERIPAGYVGVVYSMNGGVQDELLTQGFHFVNPTKHVKEFTIGNEQLILTKDEREGSKADDSFMVSTADNANISVSFQMSYRFIQSEVVDTYKRFRGMSGEDIVNSRVRTVLKKSGAPRSAISQYLSGKNMPNAERMQTLADITGVSLGFLSGEEPLPPDTKPLSVKKINTATAARCALERAISLCGWASSVGGSPSGTRYPEKEHGTTILSARPDSVITWVLNASMSFSGWLKRA